MIKHDPTLTRYILELSLAGFLGWLIAAHGVVKLINYFLSPDYGMYDWYQPFMDVVNLLLVFTGIGSAIAITVEFRHPDRYDRKQH